MTSGQGKTNQLTLLLDYNEDRSVQAPPKTVLVRDPSKKSLNLDTAIESIQGVSAKIHIDTLSSYVSFGGGMYTLAAVKRMAATEDFLKMPLKERNCEVELYQDCRTRKLLEKCNCVPWEVPGYQVHRRGQYHFRK